MANFKLFAVPTQWVDITLLYFLELQFESSSCAKWAVSIYNGDVVTHFEVSHARVSGLGGLAGGSGGGASLVLGISALTGGGLGGLRHGEGSGDSDRERGEGWMDGGRRKGWRGIRGRGREGE